MERKEMINSVGGNKGFVYLIELLLAAVIIAFLCYIMLKVYVKGPSMDKKTKETFKEEGIDTSSSKGILDSTKKKIEDINKQAAERNKQY